MSTWSHVALHCSLQYFPNSESFETHHCHLGRAHFVVSAISCHLEATLSRVVLNYNRPGAVNCFAGFLILGPPNTRSHIARLANTKLVPHHRNATSDQTVLSRSWTRKELRCARLRELAHAL